MQQPRDQLVVRQSKTHQPGYEQQNNEVHLLVNSPAEANLNGPRELELTMRKLHT